MSAWECESSRYTRTLARCSRDAGMYYVVTQGGSTHACGCDCVGSVRPLEDGCLPNCVYVFFSSRRRHTRLQGDWSSDVCSSDLNPGRPSTLACRSAPARPNAVELACLFHDPNPKRR